MVAGMFGADLLRPHILPRAPAEVQLEPISGRGDIFDHRNTGDYSSCGALPRPWPTLGQSPRGLSRAFLSASSLPMSVDEVRGFGQSPPRFRKALLSARSLPTSIGELSTPRDPATLSKAAQLGPHFGAQLKEFVVELRAERDELAAEKQRLEKANEQHQEAERLLQEALKCERLLCQRHSEAREDLQRQLEVADPRSAVEAQSEVAYLTRALRDLEHESNQNTEDLRFRLATERQRADRLQQDLAAKQTAYDEAHEVQSHTQQLQSAEMNADLSKRLEEAEQSAAAQRQLLADEVQAGIDRASQPLLDQISELRAEKESLLADSRARDKAEHALRQDLSVAQSSAMSSMDQYKRKIAELQADNEHLQESNSRFQSMQSKLRSLVDQEKASRKLLQSQVAHLQSVKGDGAESAQLRAENIRLRALSQEMDNSKHRLQEENEELRRASQCAHSRWTLDSVADLLHEPVRTDSMSPADQTRMEGMQQELARARERVVLLEKENHELQTRMASANTSSSMVEQLQRDNRALQILVSRLKADADAAHRMHMGASLRTAATAAGRAVKEGDRTLSQSAATALSLPGSSSCRSVQFVDEGHLTERYSLASGQSSATVSVFDSNLRDSAASRGQSLQRRSTTGEASEMTLDTGLRRSTMRKATEATADTELLRRTLHVMAHGLRQQEVHPDSDMAVKQPEMHGFFENFTQAQAERIMSQSKLETYHQGDIVIQQGELGTELWVIQEGELEVLVNGRVVGDAPLRPGHAVGERCLLYDDKRSATIRVASTTADLWRLDRSDFLELAKLRLRHTLEQLKRKEVGHFKNLPMASIQVLLDNATSVTYRHGEQVIAERDRSKGIFIIESGLVRILSNGHWVGDTLGPGEYFGQHSSHTQTGLKAKPQNGTCTDDCVQYTYEIASEWAILWPMENSVFQKFTRFRLVDTLRQLRKDEVPIFKTLTDEQISSACEGAELLTLDHGTAVVHQGDKGHELFVVQDGELQVIRDGKTVQFLGHGDYFGERALLQRVHVRSATIEVISSTAELWSIHKDAIASLKNLDMAALLEIRSYPNSKKSDRTKTESFHGLPSASPRLFTPRTGHSLRFSYAH